MGAGSAGSVLANRLSEDPKNKVALLEAGVEDTNPLVHAPLGFLFLMKSSLDWAYETVQQKSAAFGLKDQVR